MGKGIMNQYLIMRKPNGQLYILNTATPSGREDSLKCVRKGDVPMGHIRSNESVLTLTEGFQTEVKLENLALEGKLEKIRALIKED